jgi:hypothetical protein
MVYALHKFGHYLLSTPFTFYIDHVTLKYLSNRLVIQGRTCRWLFLFQELNFNIMLKSRRNNRGLNYISRIETNEEPNSIKKKASLVPKYSK